MSIRNVIFVFCDASFSKRSKESKVKQSEMLKTNKRTAAAVTSQGVYKANGTCKFYLCTLQTLIYTKTLNLSCERTN